MSLQEVTPSRARDATRRVVDPTQRRAEIVVAALFLATAAASIPTAFVLDPTLNAPDYLAAISLSPIAVALGSVLWSINNVGIVFIAVFLLPVLKKLDETIAFGYLATRLIEGTIMMIGVVATLALIPLSQDFVRAGAPQGSSYQTLGDVLKQVRFLCLSQTTLPLLGLGGLLFVGQLFRFHLVPRSISGVGLIGYALVFGGGLASWFGVLDARPGGSATALALPVAAFEIILLPFWLFFRGFKMPEATRVSR